MSKSVDSRKLILKFQEIYGGGLISDEKIYENSFIKRDEEVLKEIILYKNKLKSSRKFS